MKFAFPFVAATGIILTFSEGTKSDSHFLRRAQEVRDLTQTLDDYIFFTSGIRNDEKWCLTATETDREFGNLGFRECRMNDRPANQLWKLEANGLLRSGVDDQEKCAVAGFGNELFEGIRIRLGPCDLETPNNKFIWNAGNTRYLQTELEGYCVTNRGPNPHDSDIIHALECLDRGDYRWNTDTGTVDPPFVDLCAGVSCENPVIEGCDPFDGICKPKDAAVPCIAIIDESDNFSDANIEAKWATFRTTYPDRPFCLLQPLDSALSRLYLPPSFLSDSRTTFAQVSRDDLGPASEIQPSPSDWFGICGFGVYEGSDIDFIGKFLDTSGSMNETTVQASNSMFDQKVSAASLTIEEVFNEDEDWITPFLTTLVPGA